MQNNVEKDVGCVIIGKLTGNRSPLGIITEPDIVRITSRFAQAILQTPLRTLMSKPLITIERSSSKNDAIKVMNDKNIRRIMVVNGHNNMVGIIMQKDVFNVINKSARLFTEFYGDNFPGRVSQIYERFTQYKFDNLSPDL